MSGQPFNCGVRSPERASPQQLLLPGQTAQEHREGPALRQVGDTAGSSAPNGSNATSTRSLFLHIPVPGTGGLPATSTRSPFPRIRVPGTGGLPGARLAGPAYLLHEHVDVSLRRVQHVAVRVLQPPDRDLHGLAVYVYPPSRPGGQEQPETGRRMSAKVASPGIPRGSSGEDSLLLQQGV